MGHNYPFKPFLLALFIEIGMDLAKEEMVDVPAGILITESQNA